MRNVLKWLGIIAGGLVVLLLAALLVLSSIGGARLRQTRDVAAETIPIPTDSAALARGEHLVTVACSSCHGPDLTGQPLLADPAIGAIYAANLTGLAATHDDADLIRAIRHGVAPDGRQLLIMPAESFIHFSAEDLGAIIAHLKTIPPAGQPAPEPSLTLMGRTLLGAGLFGAIFPAEYIDHNQPFHAMPAIGSNEAYGEYLSRFCQACHGPELAGGQPGDPESPLAPNLTPGGRLGGWSEADFITAMRTGVTPGGRELNPLYMPWESFGKFHDEELQALWRYLQGMPATTAAQ